MVPIVYVRKKIHFCWSLICENSAKMLSLSGSITARKYNQGSKFDNNIVYSHDTCLPRNGAGISSTLPTWSCQTLKKMLFPSQAKNLQSAIFGHLVHHQYLLLGPQGLHITYTWSHLANSTIWSQSTQPDPLCIGRKFNFFSKIATFSIPIGTTKISFALSWKSSNEQGLAL